MQLFDVSLEACLACPCDRLWRSPPQLRLSEFDQPCSRLGEPVDVSTCPDVGPLFRDPLLDPVIEYDNIRGLPDTGSGSR